MLRLRTVSALALAPPVLLCTYLGSPWFELMVVAGAVVLSWEWMRLCHASGRPAAIAAVVIVTVVAVTGFGRFDLALAVAAIGYGVVLASSGGGMWAAFGVLYVGVPSAAFVWLRSEPATGLILVLWLLAVVWAFDVGAYAFGRLIGGPRLAPTLSPKKTWAGFIGGMVCAAAVGTGVAALEGGAPVWTAAIVSCALAVAAQGGDLFESSVKRRFGAKDASGLIPGHGGLLDRVDGLIAATLVAALIALAGHGSMRTWM